MCINHKIQVDASFKVGLCAFLCAILLCTRILLPYPHIFIQYYVTIHTYILLPYTRIILIRGSTMYIINAY
jgi:hypothetical protein